jgi:OOP family OmpA-OmpF porin
MATKLTPFARILIIGVPVAGIIAAALWYRDHGPAGTASVVPTMAGGAGFKETSGSAGGPATPTALPTTEVADISGPQVRMSVMAWNAQMGLLLANGGPDTTKGSLMEARGVNLNITRAADDSYDPMKAGLTACATELAGGATECASGVHFANIMGDGGPAFITGMNDLLGKLDNGKGDYALEVVGGTGRSDGEDAFMGPAACQQDPKNCKGLRIAGVIMDGDWNLAMSWAAQNQICNNPDEKTYDPDCLNWAGTSSFNEADDAFINGNCEDLPVVSKGHKTGKKQNVCIGGVVTWTPGDVTVNSKKGGVVKLLSTKQNSGQMPMTIVGIKKWDSTHPKLVQGILSGALAGGNQIKTDPRALMVAGGISATVYGEGDAGYWAKYYKGSEEPDMTGQLMVPLGGSRSWNVADAALFFGITPGSANSFAATYDSFGKIDVQQYPDRMPSFVPAAKILNLTYLRAVLAESSDVATVGKADVPDFSAAPTVDVTVARRAWEINFVTGSDKVTPESEATLAELEDALVVAGGTRVEIHGHTDAVGNADANFDLSKRRAAAVSAWLKDHAPASFPAERVAVFGHGSEQPVASNANASGQAKNRRVEIVLKAM